MSNKIRQFVSNISDQIRSRINSSRRDLNVPVSISFEPEMTTGRLTSKREVLCIKGETKDLGAEGISFLVGSIRLREHYLVGDNRILDAELDLPNGKVKMKLIGQRYEEVGQHLSVSQYIIGAEIKSMTPLDRDLYEEFLRYGNKLKDGDSKSLQLGINKS